MTDYATLLAEARAGTLTLVDDQPGPLVTTTGPQLVLAPPAGPPAVKPTRLVLPSGPDDYIWDPLVGEPPLWYERFNEYLRMPYDPQTRRRTRRRRVVDVFRAHYQRTHPGKTMPKNANSRWQEAVNKFRWYERVEAYDRWYDEEQRTRLMNRAAQEREDREMHLKSIRGKLAKRVASMTDQEIAALPVRDVVQGIVAVQRELRAEAEHAIEVDGRLLDEREEEEAAPYKAYGGDWIDQV